MELSPSPPPPMPPPSAPRTGRHIKVEYEEHSCSVKDEHKQEAKGGTKRSKDASTLSREALRRKLQYEPDGKTPRAVFRAGCHAKCLTQVLGGVGTDMERFVKEDKVLADGHVLIRAGEMYLWGRADWNTYAPSFAGDAGAYRDDLAAELREQQHKMGWAAPQTTFHLFRECTRRFLIDLPLSAYHGKDAEKKTLYCGRYRVADDDEVTSHLYFKSLPPISRRAHKSVSASWTPAVSLEVARRHEHSVSAAPAKSWPSGCRRMNSTLCMVSSLSTTTRSSTGHWSPLGRATAVWTLTTSSWGPFDALSCLNNSD
jgi:hypothetical protein